MNCCDAYGNCNQGRDCPIRKGGTAREQFELEHFGIKPAKIGKRYHAAPAYAPSHWPKTLRAWATVVLAVTLVGFIAGFVAGMV